MLNSVRCAGLCSFVRNVHWLHALTAATSIVSFGPSSSSDAKSTAYDTDIVDPERASGSVTLKTEVTDDSVSSTRNGTGEATTPNGKNAASSSAPSAITRQTNSRAPSGSAFMRRPPVRGDASAEADRAG